MALRKIIADVREGWPSYRSLKIVSKHQAEYIRVVNDFPNELKPLLPPSSSYKIQGSTGQGNITSAPWIATFDLSITKTATQGFYLVHLFSIKLQKLYLSLAFGTTQFEDYFPSIPERHAKLMSAADQLRTLLKPIRILHLGSLDLDVTSHDRMHSDYEKSNIVGIRYDLDALPSDDQLARDYRYMLELYRELVANPLLPEVQHLLESQIEPPPLFLDPIVKEFSVRKPKGKKSSGGGTKNKRISKESKKVGDRGEELVFDLEVAKLKKLGCDPSGVKWLAREGITPGWDITSIDEFGQPLHIEVKASIGADVSNLILTANEYSAAKDHKSKYCIYLVTNVMKERPTIEIIRDPLKRIKSGELTAEISAWLIGLQPNAIS
jgi:hypothetical protein